MSTVQRINFELISDAIPVVRRDFSLADRTLIDPGNANVLIDGEWAAVNDSNKLVRAADIGTAGSKAKNGSKRIRSYPLWMERGRTDVQAIGKGVVLYGGWFEADTRIFDAAAKSTGGTGYTYPAISYVGQPLQVASIVLGTRTLSGLVGADVDEFTTDIPFVVAWVSKLPATNGGKLRIRCEPCR